MKDPLYFLAYGNRSLVTYCGTCSTVNKQLNKEEQAIMSMVSLWIGVPTIVKTIYCLHGYKIMSLIFAIGIACKIPADYYISTTEKY